jgi:uncharacterized iron-regulated membrane protein
MNGRVRGFLVITHRWLGLSSAVLLAVAAATGALLAWPWPGEEPIWRAVTNRLHENLGLGIVGLAQAGYWTVTAASACGVLLVAGGFVLWWRQKILAVRRSRGWVVFSYDLHHALGVLGAAMMLLLTVSGVAIAFLRPDDGRLFEVAFALHTTRGFPWWIKLVYLVGSAAFVVQVASGVVMWWRPAGIRQSLDRIRIGPVRPPPFPSGEV